MQPVYLDYAATTPMDPRVAEAMLPYMTVCYGNPSSLHGFGQRARSAVARARAQVAELLGAQPAEIFFTSGGSESDNWALRGLAQANCGKGNHIITSQIEHHAVLHTMASLEKSGFHVTYLPVDSQGRVSVQKLEQAINDETILISIMAANNEVGTLEPLAEIGALAKRYGICFHTDAVQAAGHMPLDVRQLAVQAMSVSAHKFYGPKGMGALYLRQGSSIVPYLLGGAQERGMRAGTENVPGIVGMGKAAEIAVQTMQEENYHLCRLRDFLLCELQHIPEAWVNGSLEYRLSGNVNFGVRNISNDVLLLRLDLAGFAVSGGSACSAGAIEPSHVLLAMGQTEGEANAAIRVTIGRHTTREQLESFLFSLKNIIADIKQKQEF